MVEIFDNIRKLYAFQPPCAELQPHVEFYSETAPAAMHAFIGEAPFTVKMFPSYTPTIWLNLGTPYQLKHGHQLSPVGAQTDVLILRSGIVERRNLPTDNIFTIKFNPGGFEAIFGIPQTTIGHGIVDVAQLIPATVLRKIKRGPDFASRRQLIEQYLLDQLHKHHRLAHTLSTVQQAIDVFTHTGMQLNNRQLADRHYLTEKTFYRYCTQVIGASPKHYFATLRARHALTAYVTQRPRFDHTQFGYYDLPHFYKDIVRFTGRKISEQ